MDNDDEIVYLSSKQKDKKPGNKRAEERIAHVFDIKFCRVNGEKKWDVANIRNLSKKGIMFYTVDYYAPGVLLNVIIVNPFSRMRTLSATGVIRCTHVEKMGGLYETVIDVAMLGEEIKGVLYRTIDHIQESKKKF